MKWLLPLLLLFLCADRASAVVPYMVQPPCYVHGNDASTSSMTCQLTNTHTGTGYRIFVMYAGIFTSATVSSTESLTCPAAATVQHIFFGSETQTLAFCYVDPASTHSTFTLTVSNPVGAGSIRINNIAMMEMYGFGTVDTSAITGNANGTSVNVTTNNANEYIEAVGYDYSSNAFVGSGFSQRMTGQGDANNQTYRFIEEYQLAATTGTYTTAFTTVNSLPRAQIVAIPMQTAGTNPLPSPLIKQVCVAANFAGLDLRCDFSGLVAGNKLVFGGTSDSTGALLIAAGGCTGETCTCPANSQINHTFGGTSALVGLCYADLASSHATYTTGLEVGAPNAVFTMTVMEISGINVGIDTGSEATAVGQSLSYTTAQSNEYTVVIYLDSPGTPQAPGGAIPQVSQVSDPTKFSYMHLTMSGTTTASGSNSTSVTGANTIPLMATFSFGVPSTATIKFKSQIM